MYVTFSTEDGSVSERLEVNGDMQVSELRGLLEAIFSIPSNQQVFISAGRELGTTGTLSSIGIKENDFVLIVNTGNRTMNNAGNRVAAANANSTGNAVESGNRNGLPPGANAWDGMSVQDVFENNTNPQVIAQIIRSRENLIKELHFHNPKLADAMGKDEETAVRELRMFMMMNTTAATLNKVQKNKTEAEMKARLEKDPNDSEAKNFFDEKDNQALVDESYMQMMQEFPEALTRVLMLYIEVEINGTPLQAFVDSGAQTSVISAGCAERCGLTKLIDKRFAGQVVGVGSGRTLGRVHIAPLKIEGKFFPMSLTVMDDSQGLGDKNMEFLLGLDMLKRHRCRIDLVDGQLYFTHNNEELSTPFLHEKDLPQSKGGTKGFNPNEEPKRS